MLKVNVKADIDLLVAKLKATEREIMKAVPRSLNKTANTARAEAARLIVDQGYGIKVSYIKRGITVNRASSNDYLAVVRASGKPIPLIQYKARQTKAGVTVQVKNGRKLIKDAFIATMSNGHQGVFLRKEGSKHVSRRVRKGGPALPIDELFGPSIPTAFQNKIVMQELTRSVRERFPVVLKQELSFVISKR